jgi:hypothetical protein
MTSQKRPPPNPCVLEEIDGEMYERTELAPLDQDHTGRGFGIYRFRDKSDVDCSIQASSLATEAAIWFGVQDTNPKIMASDARKLGLTHLLTRGETTGWVSFPIPDQVIMQDRMHLTQRQVQALLPILQHFADTGELP